MEVPRMVAVNGQVGDGHVSNGERAPVVSVMEAVSPEDKVSEIPSKILAIIYEYALNKFEDTVVRHAAGAAKFLSVIKSYVAEGKQVKMCLPAFPFKSANKVYKVFGILPDKAEELALERLNTMCERIADVYEPGAKLTVISDGLVYNDLLCIPDQDVWAYGQALRAMAVEKAFTHVDFSRLRDLSDLPLPEKLEEIIYVANATNFRRHLLNKWGRDDIDIEHEIATKPDTLMTYRGYCRFLESDLQHVFPSGSGRVSPNSSTRSIKLYKKNIKFLAKEMLIRGYAFAGACKAAFPDHLRLSIHQSTGEHKVSMSLLDTKTGYTTPWHCSVAQMVDGQWLSAPMGDFKENPLMEVVFEDGRPSYFREKAPELPPTPPVASVAASVTDESSSEPTAPCSCKQSLETPSEERSVARSSATEPASASVAPPVTTASSDYGKRLIPHILDDLAAADPTRVIFSVAKSSDLSQGLQKISALDMAKAVNKTAWWLHNQVGKSSSPKTVGYIGPHDLRYVLLTYACIKTGHEVLFLSSKNSVEGALAVLQAADGKFWVQPAEQPVSRLIETCLERRPMQVLHLPPVDELLDADSAEHYPYDKTFEQAAEDVFCILHTSGSTGLPKPMKWSHALLGTMDAVRLLPPTEGDLGMAPWTSLFEEKDKIYSSFPMSHGAGVIMNMVVPSFFAMHCVMGPAGVIPNMGLIESLADHASLDVWSMVPTVVDELGETPDVLAKFHSSKFICASGGPTSPISAGKVNEVVRVLNLTGTTEGLFIGNLVVDRDDWRYFAFHPYSGFEFRELESGGYEHWCRRNKHGPLFQGIFHTFPDKDEVNLKDLYVKHPTKPGHWAFKGRSDDIVVLSNGYKISPLDTEALITNHPAVNGCLLVGMAKPQAALLELKDPAAATPVDKELFESIWQVIQRANGLSTHKDQLSKDCVMFAEADKPFVRTDKDTIKRHDTLALYADYIERFYSSIDPETTLSVTVDTSSVESIVAAVREIIAFVLPGLQHVAVDADLFNLGLDSLRVVHVIRALQGATGLQDILAPRHLYANPTVAKFSAALAKLGQGAKTGNGDAELEEKLTKMKGLLEKYKAPTSLKMTEMDHMMPKLYANMLLYIPLRDGVSFEKVFAGLQAGLARTIGLVPTLDYKITDVSKQEPGYKPGQVHLTPPDQATDPSTPRQLIYRDLSHVLPSFDKLREGGFVASKVNDDLVCQAPYYPSLPADIMLAQANFVSGGCLLVVGFHHSVFDGTGFVTVMRAWAESCRYLQGDVTATGAWINAESMNRSLPHVIYEQEGYAKPASEIDPSVWSYLGFQAPEDVDATKVNFSTPPAPSFRPPPSLQDHHLDTSMFYISPENLAHLQAEVAADPLVKDGTPPSASDIIQAVFWRAAIRARHAVAKDLHKATYSSDAVSILELPIDGRPYFSSRLPATYMGNLLVINRPTMSLSSLVSADTSIAQIALLLRESSSHIRPSLFHDAYTLMRTVGDYTTLKYAFMRHDGMDLMITNLMLFATGVLAFGGEFFGSGGEPAALRLLHGVQNAAHRMGIVLPMCKDGGVELLLGMWPEELERMKEDEEWMSFATFMG